jgi:hypothetical protein
VTSRGTRCPGKHIEVDSACTQNSESTIRKRCHPGNQFVIGEASIDLLVQEGATMPIFFTSQSGVGGLAKKEIAWSMKPRTLTGKRVAALQAECCHVRRLCIRFERRGDIHEALLKPGCSLVCWSALQRAEQCLSVLYCKGNIDTRAAGHGFFHGIGAFAIGLQGASSKRGGPCLPVDTPGPARNPIGDVWLIARVKRSDSLCCL